MLNKLREKLIKKEEVYPKAKDERRILTHVPDPSHIRQKTDRRGETSYEKGVRYKVECPVSIDLPKTHKKIKGTLVDISVSGALISISSADQELLLTEKEYKLHFKIPTGSILEGYDQKVRIYAAVKRKAESLEETNTFLVGFKFRKDLDKHFKYRRWFADLTFSSFFLAFIVFLIALMRVESIIYFKYAPLFYGYSILTATYLLTRYLFGGFYRPVPINKNYTPGVSVIIPCFNEQRWIQKTIISCLNQDYPTSKLEVIVVDDCSTDGSVEAIEKTIALLKEKCGQYELEGRIKFIPLKENSGKRVALVKGMEAATHELVTFVDSDSFLKPQAIRHLVQPFRDPKVGGVTGRTDVENAWTNSITKMQAVRYYVAFRMIKAAESIFDAVTCLSGPISCYRKELVEYYKEDWLSQTFFGQPATFGDDRSMTNYILKNHRTVYQDTAICTTIVPSEFKVFLKQQMRWKRSWLRESLRAGSFMWKKEPFQALSFYAGFIVPLLAPFVILYNVVYVPLTYGIFPWVFLIGILLMSFLMSFIYLWFRKSKIWIYGLWFCLFYEGILVWQMPIACLTFWKSTWGTRQTKEDVLAEAKKEAKKIKRRGNNEYQSTNGA
ncbi:hyaluronan synthase [Sporanaerobium hydrogeniformans]|uniref:Hyaluronan synthase n=1 Tax=Sporanaerobium hydrogeniformans TaxID=3072179 RepID=A0AC61DG53_9FIRM|nr:glycosyltransferase [Sporanaerobium hydrogeniformans]PHV72234.1 hyaluronan synthase [Sporanaerobium hydrogeniformans]